MMLVYLLVVLIYAVMQRSMIYYPQQQAIDTAQHQAAEQGGSPWMGPEGEWLGWKVPADALTHRRAVVFHGNAGQALHRVILPTFWQDLMIPVPGRFISMSTPDTVHGPGRPVRKPWFLRQWRRWTICWPRIRHRC